jgi:hypothetical protein
MAVPPSTTSDTLPTGRSIPELTVTVTTPFAPAVIEGALIVIVVGAWFTVKLPDAVLARKLGCATYDAVKLWVVALGAVIRKVADPLPFSGCVVAAPPSTLNDTLPVGVPDAELTSTVTLPFTP